MKVHFNVNDRAECKRGSILTTDVYRVTCELCKNKPEFETAWVFAQVAKQAAFVAQVPRRFVEPWQSTTQSYITCRGCEGELFRQGDRSCMGHYDNFVCANCGETTSRLTETGMSF